ncbi:SGNH/GDSL hydrolase family protein [Leptospira fletcheri]|uniref:SGNH/GDSL hydrolase family protein n=1 Tax=Leptospira fletcheri TaxID=2484981 RepID=A0A4R9GI32_9LEPT|nr:SGNH/GDSL hydrolase family protein [Leptospira fletcheri]TGK12390.1 SGNH/GDSL hydrolase family protein [Leptospira fletcheri]
MSNRRPLEKYTLLILVFFGVFACQNIALQAPIYKSSSANSADNPIQNPALMYLIADQVTLTPDECTSTYIMTNLVWPLPANYGRISSNTRNYQTLIGIDSTIDIASQYSNFLNPETTFSVAVGGNTACDAITQLNSIKTPNPQNFVISSADGNGLLHGIHADDSVKTMIRLVSKIRNRWPNVKIVVVGVHPTRLQGINSVKDYTNSQIATYLKSLTHTCYYDPMPLFDVGPGESAPASLMLDSIHYNRNISFQIKEKLMENCEIPI